ncbi:hypothetical protein GIB67_018541 [Kingdonia uniflora]|uniref:Nucleolar complex-associated protein 3 N-terminal domain-containing protein n=1 Tax=Kingdonia uniflora TaxID=39325 RepID=A0A7J7LWG0_9MAGN|nr:hypothetical protein GIB67_018541 [Kingdonia uniflora]
MGNKNKIILLPQLPSYIADDDIEVSDEDLSFVKENKYHASRVADAKDDTLEASYENSKRNKFSNGDPKENGIEVDRVDVLPVKTLDGKLIFKSRNSREPKVNKKEDEGAADNDGIHDSLAELKEDLSAEKLFDVKKNKYAELGMSLLADPEANIKSLKGIVEISKDKDRDVIKLGLLSLSAVFKDIIPGYVLSLMN